MARFVILQHDHPLLHWDLMLECAGVLRTWRLAEEPHPGGVVRAEASFDHRLFYLDYEGPVSGNRGVVRRWDHGTYALVAEQEDALTFKLHGERLHGAYRLHKSGCDEWFFTAVCCR